MVRLLLALLGLGLFACEAPPRRVREVATAKPSPRPQPRPGQRVPQPELDGYCSGSERPAAFYYHGGRPVVRIARADGCAPLFMTECQSTGRCYPPRDQEPGMWCCSSAQHEQQTNYANNASH